MIKNLIKLIFLSILTTSCIETALVTGVVTGVTITKKGKLFNIKDDALIESRIKDKLIKDKLIGRFFKNNKNSINITVVESRVLLTGVVEKESDIKKIYDITWQVRYIKEVINEIQISSNKKLYDNVVDLSITTRLKTKIFLENIKNINVKITTSNNVVYLLGTVNDNSQIKKITKIAANIIGVKKVVSYLKVNNNKENSSHD